VRGVGLFGVVGAADDAVLMITQQCLDGFGSVGHLLGAGHCVGVAQPLGTLANPVERRVVVLGVGGGGLGALADPLLAVLDGRRGQLFLIDCYRSRFGDELVQRVE
jgi:hypothetical protein